MRKFGALTEDMGVLGVTRQMSRFVTFKGSLRNLDSAIE